MPVLSQTIRYAICYAYRVAVICAMAVAIVLVVGIASTVLKALLGFALVPAALVLGAMNARMLNGLIEIFIQPPGRQQNGNMSTTNETIMNATSERVPDNNQNMSNNEQVSTLQQQDNAIQPKYAKCIAEVVAYTIFDILFHALMSHLSFAPVTELTSILFIGGFFVGGYMPYSVVGKELNSAADVTSAYVLNTLNNAYNNDFTKKSVGFLCESVDQIFHPACSYCRNR